MGRYDNKVALLTGAGSGIGRAVAQRLADEGAVVLGVDINGSGLAETVSGSSATIDTLVADLTDPTACRAAVEACIGRHGRLDVLGNIAGITLIEHATDVTVDQYRRVMAINVDAPFFMSQAAIPHLLDSDGCIVNIASNAGLMGQAYTAVYCMSKGAVVQLTRALAMELAKSSVRVNAIAPGTTNTPLVQSVTMPVNLDFDLMAPYIGFRPPAQPEEIAGLFAYLASSDARSVHGAVVSADNGVTAG